MTPQRTSVNPFKVVIVGGGVAGWEAALTLQELAGDLVQTTVLSPESEYVYRPFSVREPFAEPAAAHYLLSDLAALAGATHRVAALQWLTPGRRTVHTNDHEEMPYDAVLLAQGAKQYASLPHVITIDPKTLDEQLHGVIQDIEIEAVSSVAFIVPPGRSWPLAAYELAVMTARRAYDMCVSPQITIITPEKAPLEVFGELASRAVSELLNEAGIELITDARASIPAPGRIRINGGARERRADSIVALPQLLGLSVPGVPATALHSFIATDPHGQVLKLDRVFAAGDITNYPVKQGAIAAQQAVCAAHTIAALAGAPVPATPFLPTIHGVLIGPRHPLYMRARLAGGRAATSEVSESPLWKSADKIHAPRLTEALARCQPMALATPREMYDGHGVSSHGSGPVITTTTAR